MSTEDKLGQAIDGFVVYQQARFRYLLAFCCVMFFAQCALLVMAAFMLQSVQEQTRSLSVVERTTQETRVEVDKKPSLDQVASALPSAVLPLIAPSASVQPSASVKGPR